MTVDAGSGSAKPQDGAGRVEGSDATAQRVLSRLAGQILVIRPCLASRTAVGWLGLATGYYV